MPGGSYLMDTGVHCIDLLRFLLESKVTEVRALYGPKELRDVGKMSLANLKYENGGVGY
ncbi:Gfo/Idh/MocA family oxidoreductase [Chloroflexota bacterium]